MKAVLNKRGGTPTSWQGSNYFTGHRQLVSRPRSRRCCLQVVALLKVSQGHSASWTQDFKNVYVQVPVPEGTRGRDVKLDAHPKRLKLTVGGTVVLEGSIDHPEGLAPDECFFEMEDLPLASSISSSSSSSSATAPPVAVSGRVVLVTLGKREKAKDAMGYVGWDKLLQTDVPDTTFTHWAYMDLAVAGQAAGRLIIGLYGNVVPRTVQNFLGLCRGSSDGGSSSSSSSSLGYQGTSIFRIMPGFLIQGGDVERDDGSGGRSIFGGPLQDENFSLPHDSEGVVSMANRGPNTATSQFQFVLGAYGFLDSKHVVFGRVVHGLALLRRLEELELHRGSDKPLQRVSVEGCGEMSREEYEAVKATLPAEPTPRANPLPGSAARPAQRLGQGQRGGLEQMVKERMASGAVDMDALMKAVELTGNIPEDILPPVSPAKPKMDIGGN